VPYQRKVSRRLLKNKKASKNKEVGDNWGSSQEYFLSFIQGILVSRELLTLSHENTLAR